MAYTYDKQLWKDYPNTSTPITADRLNHMEDGIKGLSDAQVSIEVVDSLDGNSTTNAPSVHAVNQVLGNIRGQILWTNPNPTENFASQTITLNSNDYDYLWWIFYSSAEAVRVVSAYSIKGLGVNIDSIINLNIGVSQPTGVRERQIGYINDKQYLITNCLERESSASSIPIERQDRLILAYVIGYKTGLFN